MPTTTSASLHSQLHPNNNISKSSNNLNNNTSGLAQVGGVSTESLTASLLYLNCFGNGDTAELYYIIVW